MAQILNLDDPSAPLAAKPDYTSYCDYLESRGWTREQLVLDELNTNLVTLFGLSAGATGTVIDIRAPAGQKISMMGIQQIPRGADARSAHALRIRFADTGDAEIPIYSKVRVTKEKTSEAIIQLVRCFYADMNLTKSVGPNTTQKTDPEFYRWTQGVELNGEQHLKFILINTELPATSVDAAHIKFALVADLWTKEE
jgi:hypothetical protein